jgi:hypothetical protein
MDDGVLHCSIGKGDCVVILNFRKDDSVVFLQCIVFVLSERITFWCFCTAVFSCIRKDGGLMKSSADSEIESRFFDSPFSSPFVTPTELTCLQLVA